MFSTITKEKLLALLHVDPRLIRFAPVNMRDNEECIRFVVTKNGHLLLFASERLKNSTEIVNLAVKNNPYAIQYASTQISKLGEINKPNNKYIIKNLIQDGGAGWRCACGYLNNEGIVECFNCFAPRSPAIEGSGSDAGKSNPVSCAGGLRCPLDEIFKIILFNSNRRYMLTSSTINPSNSMNTPAESMWQLLAPSNLLQDKRVEIKLRTGGSFDSTMECLHVLASIQGGPSYLVGVSDDVGNISTIISWTSTNVSHLVLKILRVPRASVPTALAGTILDAHTQVIMPGGSGVSVGPTNPVIAGEKSALVGVAHPGVGGGGGVSVGPARPGVEGRGITIGYHQTNLVAALAILRTQQFLSGSTGIVGPGIYFAETGSDTEQKTQHGNDVTLQAVVDLGRTLSVTYSNDNNPTANASRALLRQITSEKLAMVGFDSVTVSGLSSGIELVVYDSARVTEIRVWSHSGMLTPFQKAELFKYMAPNTTGEKRISGFMG